MKTKKQEEKELVNAPISNRDFSFDVIMMGYLVMMLFVQTHNIFKTVSLVF